MIISAAVACKRVAKDSEVTPQQEEVMEIDETIATEEEENNGLAANTEIEIIDNENDENNVDYVETEEVTDNTPEDTTVE